MVSAFIKGVGLGILEGAAEVIESDYDRMKKTREMLINHHLKSKLQFPKTMSLQMVSSTLRIVFTHKLPSIIFKTAPTRAVSVVKILVNR